MSDTHLSLAELNTGRDAVTVINDEEDPVPTATAKATPAAATPDPLAPDPKRNLAQRIVTIRKIIGGRMKERGTAPPIMGSFGFIQWDDVADEIGTLLAEHGVVIWPSGTAELSVAGQSREGKPIFRAQVAMSFVLENADDPQDTRTCVWPGQGDDHSDKSVNKAITSGEKYFLLKLFLLGGERAGVVDADSGDAAIASSTQANGSAPTATAPAQGGPPPARRAPSGNRPVKEPAVDARGVARGCPQCGTGKLELTTWANGDRYIACSDWKNCKYREQVPDETMANAAVEPDVPVGPVPPRDPTGDVDPDEIPF